MSEKKNQMSQWKISLRFLWELCWLVFAVHFIYSIVFLGITINILSYNGSSSSELFSTIRILGLIFLYFAPLPVIIAYFIRSEKKAIATGKPPIKRGTIVRSEEEVAEGIKAIILGLGIYLPFIFLLVILGFLMNI
jgi:hypothetical protein